MRLRVAAVVLFVVMVAANVRMDPWHAEAIPSSVAHTPTEAVLSVLGELRGFIARMLWFKVDIYHHEIETSEHRSSIGDKSIIAMHRAITILDPHFYQAYDVGAYDLWMAGQREAAMAFLNEGLANNPRAQILWFDRALFLYKMKQYTEAANCAIRAYIAADNDVDALNALRLMAVSFRGERDYVDEYRTYKKWLQLRPGDIIPINRLKVLEAQGITDQPKPPGH